MECDSVKKLVVLILVFILSLSLVACGSNNNDESSGDKNVQNDNNNPPSEDNDEEEGFTLDDIAQIPVGKSIDDDELGYTITVEEMVKNIPNEKTAASGEFGIALKVRLERNSNDPKFVVGAFRASFLQLLVNGEAAKERFKSFSDYAEEQGWGKLKPPKSKEDSSEGWLIFIVTDSSATFTFRHERPEIPVRVIGDKDYTIPAKDFDIEL